MLMSSGVGSRPDELHRSEDPRRPAVAVVERMDGDDVEVEQRRPDQRRRAVRVPQPLDELVHERLDDAAGSDP